MDAYKDLLRACNQNEYKNFDELNVGSYPVEKFIILDTKNGKKLAVHLKDCLVFLPNRFNAYINEEQVDELNSQNYIMIYSGKVKTQRNRVKLSFDLMKDKPLTSNADVDVPESSKYRKNIIKVGKALGLDNLIQPLISDEEADVEDKSGSTKYGKNIVKAGHHLGALDW